jgi:hypothetical protein
MERNKSDSSLTTDKNQQTSVHVPFRDSVLTRLLKNVLSGNCFLSMITIPPSNNVDGISRALRFASQIGKLFNMIWINEEVLLKQQLVLRNNCPSSLTDEKLEPALENEMKGNEKEQNVASEAYQQFSSLQNEMFNQMNLLANELDQLELWRLSALEKLSLQLLPVKESSEKQHQNTVAYLQQLTREDFGNDVDDNKIVNSESAKDTRVSIVCTTKKTSVSENDATSFTIESIIANDKSVGESPSRKLIGSSLDASRKKVSNKIILRSLQSTSNITPSASLSVTSSSQQPSRNIATSGGSRRPSVVGGNGFSSLNTLKRSVDTNDNLSDPNKISSGSSVSSIRKKSGIILNLNSSQKTGARNADFNGFKGTSLLKGVPRINSLDKNRKVLTIDCMSSSDGDTTADKLESDRFNDDTGFSGSASKDFLSHDGSSLVESGSDSVAEVEGKLFRPSHSCENSVFAVPPDQSFNNSLPKLPCIPQCGNISVLSPSLLRSPQKDTVFQSFDTSSSFDGGKLSHGYTVNTPAPAERMVDGRMGRDKEDLKLLTSPNESVKSSFMENSSKVDSINEQEVNSETEEVNRSDDSDDAEGNSNRLPRIKLQLSLSKNNSTSLPAILKVSRKLAEKEEEMLDGLFKKKKSYSKYEIENREEENDDEDDGLTDIERIFLRAVSTGNMSKIQSCLQKGVNIHVKNSFERYAVALLF